MMAPLGLTLLLLVLFKISQTLLPESWFAFVIPVLLLYVPFFYLHWKTDPINFLDRSWAQLGKGILAFLIAVLVIFPPFLLCAHFWMIHVFHLSEFHPASWTLFFSHVGFQVLAVAIPEEFYFRGFLQEQLNRVWKPKLRFLGVNLGWGFLITALVFAFAHSVIVLRWWHFSIFFPALVFGYLKEKTGSITAPILFHAFSNCFMDWFSRSYF